MNYRILMAKLIKNKDEFSWDNMPDIDLGLDISGDWIKLWEDFCRKNKLKVVLPYSDAKSRDEQSVNAYVMLINIVRIKNAGWVADLKNQSQYKYYPYFYMKAGSGFVFGAAAYAHSGTLVGLRLCFQTSKLAEDTAKEFLPIYRVYMMQD